METQGDRQTGDRHNTDYDEENIRTHTHTHTHKHTHTHTLCFISAKAAIQFLIAPLIHDLNKSYCTSGEIHTSPSLPHQFNPPSVLTDVLVSGSFFCHW